MQSLSFEGGLGCTGALAEGLGAASPDASSEDVGHLCSLSNAAIHFSDADSLCEFFECAPSNDQKLPA